MTVELAHRPFTVDEYYLMAEVGILKEDDRLELIDGRIVPMSPAGSRHAACVKRLNALLGAALGPRATVSVQDPIRLDLLSEPQPDVALLRPRDDFYVDAHPDPSDVLLLVEVADTSEDYDREVKLPLYAQAGIRELWIVCLRDDLILVHSEPVGRAYREVWQASRGESIEVRHVPNLTIPVADVLG